MKILNNDQIKILSEFKEKALIKKQPGAVIINAGDSNGYGVIVNLGRKGVPILSVYSNAENITRYSKYAFTLVCPDYKLSEKKFIEFLLAIGKGLTVKPVLFVTGDLQLLAVLRHRKPLEKYFCMPMAALEKIETLVDKVLFYKTLEKFNLPHAATITPKDVSELIKKSHELEYPCIIKPVQSTSFVAKFGNKCLKAESPDKLVELYKKVRKEEDDIIIQKEIIGTERYLVYMYFDKHSNAKAACCYKKLRIQPVDFGNASACKTVWDPEVVALAKQCLSDIEYTGFAEAEIQRDHSDGTLKLVEINARSTTQTRLSARCGMNMEYLAYKEMLGENIKNIEPSKEVVIWIDIFRDILAVFSPDGYLSQRRMRLRQVLQSLKGKREYAYLAWDDPVPFIMLFYRFLKTYGFRKKHILLSIFKSI